MLSAPGRFSPPGHVGGYPRRDIMLAILGPFDAQSAWQNEPAAAFLPDEVVFAPEALGEIQAFIENTLVGHVMPHQPTNYQHRLTPDAKLRIMS